jgi:hypothetical protein
MLAGLLGVLCVVRADPTNLIPIEWMGQYEFNSTSIPSEWVFNSQSDGSYPDETMLVAMVYMAQPNMTSALTKAADFFTNANCAAASLDLADDKTIVCATVTFNDGT